MDKIGFGGQHDVFQKRKGYVRKIPNGLNTCSFEEAKKSAELSRNYIENIICPPTKVVPSPLFGYIIIQKEIQGILLREASEKDLSFEVLKQLDIFVQKILYALKEDGIRFDVIGILKGETAFESKEKLSGPYIVKIIKHYMRVRNIFQSSNIILVGDTIKFIDTVFTPKKFNKELLFQKLRILYWTYIFKGYRNQISVELKKRAK